MAAGAQPRHPEGMKKSEFIAIRHWDLVTGPGPVAAILFDLAGHLGSLRLRAEQVRSQAACLEPTKLRNALVFLPLADRRLGDPEKAGDLGVGASPERFSELHLGHRLAVHGATLRPLKAIVKSAKGDGG